MNGRTLLIDESTVREFVDVIVPALVRDEVLLLILIARKKYEPSLKTEGNVIKGLINTNDPDITFRKIKRFCVVDDLYIDLKTRKPIPLNAFVLYINLLPKSMYKAYINFRSEINKLIDDIATGKQKIDRFQRLKGKFYSHISKIESKSRRTYYTIDIDVKDPRLLEHVLHRIDHIQTWINETRGGYHVLIKKENITRSAGMIIQKELTQHPHIEKSEQPLTAIPGTLQGGFLVKRLKIT